MSTFPFSENRLDITKWALMYLHFSCASWQCPCTMIHEIVACSSLIAQGYCMESWLDLLWDCWESNQSPGRFKGQDLMDSLSPTTPVGIRTTLRGQRLLQVVHGIMYGETVLATEHIKSISVFLEKSQDSRAVWWSSSDGGHTTPTFLVPACYDENAAPTFPGWVCYASFIRLK